MAHPAAPRWPYVRLDRGHYESYYLRAVDPARPRGVWIRYTVTRPPGRAPEGHLWCTYFDRDRDRPVALRAPAGEPATGPGEWIRLGDSLFGAGEAVGEVQAPGGTATWALRWPTGGEPLLHLPAGWMYSASFPRTKLLSLAPSCTFDGRLRIGEEEVAVDGWPGMVGHNWGEQHADRWIWLHGLGFDEAAAGTWVDVAVAKVRLGPVTTPWVANGAVSVDGRRLRLGGLGRPVRATPTATGCTLELPGSGVRLSATVTAPASAFAEWDYPNPDGRVHRVVNCSVADLTLRLTMPGRDPVDLSSPGRGAYEFGRAGA